MHDTQERSPQGDSSREIRGQLVGLSFSSACLTPKPQHARILVDLQHLRMAEAQPPNWAPLGKVWGPELLPLKNLEGLGSGIGSS